MVSLRALERDNVVNVVPRNEVDWLSAVENLKFALVKRGFDYDRAEELSHAAMVEVYESNEFISRQRVSRDMIGAAYGIAHRESAERQTIEPAEDLPLTQEAGRLRIDRRTSYESTTAQTRNAIAAKRAERKLLENYGWLISQAVQTVAPEQRLMRYLSELAYSAYGDCEDTTQFPPVTGRTVVVEHVASLPIVPVRTYANGIGSNCVLDMAERGVSCFTV